MNSKFKMNKRNRQYFDSTKSDQYFYYMSLMIGDYKFSSRNTDINGWLVCNGRSLLREEYPELFEAIGTNFGATDSNHFNIPDFRGKVFGQIGQGSGLSQRELGEDVGAETVTLTYDEIPEHDHGGFTENAGTHNHIASTATSGSHNHSGTTGLAGAHNHTYQDAYFAENTGTNNLLYGTGAGTDTDNAFVWRTQGGGYSTTPSDINTSTELNHMHGITTDGTHNHSVTVNNDGEHSHVINSVGGNEAHNNMQPTLFAGNVLIFSKFLEYHELEGLNLRQIKQETTI